MNILITGGAGFIGSHLVEALVAEGHYVRVVDNLSTGTVRNIPVDKVDFICGDAGGADYCYAIDYVFHLAAIASVQKSIEDPIATQQHGEDATLRLLRYAAKNKVKRFIFAASSAAYGDLKYFDESNAPRPLSPYAASKVACEGYVRAYAKSMGLDGVSLRYFNIFGARQDPNSPYSGVISIFLRQMLAGGSPSICGTGLQSRDFTHVDNVIQANLLAMKYPTSLDGEVFNIGCGRQTSILDLVTAINKKLGVSLAPIHVPAREGEAFCSCADISKAKTILGYSPTILLEEGIAKLIESQPNR